MTESPLEKLWRPPEKRGRLHTVEIEIRRECGFKKKPDGKRGCLHCGKAKTDEAHLGVPASFNMGGSGSNHFVYQNAKKLWMRLITRRLIDAALPRPLGYVGAEGLMCFPTRTKRDQGNFRIMVEKALGDALTEGGWLADDSWDFYEFGGLAQTYEKGVAYTRLMIFPEWEKREVPEAAPAQGALEV